jgi:hypothetical protein
MLMEIETIWIPKERQKREIEYVAGLGLTELVPGWYLKVQVTVHAP